MYTNAIGELVVKPRADNAAERIGEQASGFGDVLTKYEEAGKQRVTKTQKQSAYDDEAKSRQRKLIEMRSRIAELKAKVREPGTNEAIESELSLLQMEMFWLMTEL